MKKLLLICLVFFVYCKDNHSSGVSPQQVNAKPVSAKALLENRFKEKIDSLLPLAKIFIKSNNYNESMMFIADLSMHSGMDRFAIVDLKQDSIIHKAMVAHGVGGRYFSATARYSNVAGSLCSSPGKYKVGTRYSGRFGKAYKLFGLDKTNSNAFNRAIVLHAYECVPDEATYPQHLCNSQGCPMVSYQFLDLLSKYIDKSSKPLLLWIVG